MVLKLKYNSQGMFHHPVTLPEFKILRKYLDDACAKHDVENIVMYANQLIPDLVGEEDEVLKSEKEKIDGQQITSLWTFNLDTYINASINEECYKISLDTVVQMINEFEFDIVEKRVYKHLENPKRLK